MAGRPLKFKSVQELQTRIDEYFITIDTLNLTEGNRWEPYTVCGLALHLDVDRLTLINYSEKPGFFNTIKRAKQKIEAQLERNLSGQAVTGTIFNLKNNFGWKDQQQLEHSGPDGGPIQQQSAVAIVDYDPNDPKSVKRAADLLFGSPESLRKLAAGKAG